MDVVIRPGWTKQGHSWLNEDAPGYEIVQIGLMVQADHGYEVYVGDKRIGPKVRMFGDAVKIVAGHMTKDEPGGGR